MKWYERLFDRVEAAAYKVELVSTKIKKYTYERNGKLVKVKTHERTIKKKVEPRFTPSDQRKIAAARKRYEEEDQAKRDGNLAAMADRGHLRRLAAYGNDFDVYQCRYCHKRWVADWNHRRSEPSDCGHCFARDGIYIKRVLERDEEVQAIRREWEASGQNPYGRRVGP